MKFLCDKNNGGEAGDEDVSSQNGKIFGRFGKFILIYVLIIHDGTCQPNSIKDISSKKLLSIGKVCRFSP